MSQLEEAFDERLTEIEAYLDFLEGIEKLVQSGVPRLGGDGDTVTVLQQKILYSSVYLQLYNLVEATVTRSLNALTQVALVQGGWKPAELRVELRREWVKVVVGTNKEMNAENRLNSAVALCQLLIDALPVESFKLEKGGGGNWDDAAIEKMLERIGLKLKLTPAVRTAAKQKFRDDRGALGVVVKLRNDLAHGSISFAECGDSDTVSELRDLTAKVSMYLRTVARAVERFIDRYEFLIPDRRPVVAA